MLNIISILRKNTIAKFISNDENTIKAYKRDIPLSKEWYNSLYMFNKNPIRFLPAVHEYVFKLMKSYFNMTNEVIEKHIKFRRYNKIKRSLGNKVWISTPEIKHINKKITITVYIYNRLYNQYKKELSLLELNWGPIKVYRQDLKKMYLSKEEKKSFIIEYYKNLTRKKKMKFVEHKSIIYFRTDAPINGSDIFLIKIIKWLKLDKSTNMGQYKLDIAESIKKNELGSTLELRKINFERFSYLINQFKKELVYIKLKQKILFNKFKFNELCLSPLVDCLEAIYRKKIEFNFVMLKNYYLSSSILSQIIVAKVISVENRGQPTIPIHDSMGGIKISSLSSKKLPRVEKPSIGINNVVLDKLVITKEKQDLLNKFLLTKNKKSKIWSSKYIDSLALKNIENKSVAGIFVKVAGRLTKRYKAQRAMSALKQKGTLKNAYSAHEGFTSALSRGYSNINVEKTMIHSKVRIGGFGITGWVASY